MKTWNLRLVGILCAALVAVVAAVVVSVPASYIQMPDGVWLFVRMPKATVVAGGRYRTYVWGTDTVVRVELDTDGDGRYDIRGDDWQSLAPPRWCWVRSASVWEPANPEHCAEAQRQLVQGPK